MKSGCFYKFLGVFLCKKSRGCASDFEGRSPYAKKAGSSKREESAGPLLSTLIQNEIVLLQKYKKSKGSKMKKSYWIHHLGYSTLCFLIIHKHFHENNP